MSAPRDITYFVARRRRRALLRTPSGVRSAGPGSEISGTLGGGEPGVLGRGALGLQRPQLLVEGADLLVVGRVQRHLLVDARGPLGEPVESALEARRFLACG